MRSLYRHRLVLTLTGPILIALGLPLIVPFAATLLGETMHLQMRLSLPESLLGTLGILVAWFVISRTIDVVLSGSDIGGKMTGRLVSAGASVLVLGGGYLLITGTRARRRVPADHRFDSVGRDHRGRDQRSVLRTEHDARCSGDETDRIPTIQLTQPRC